MTSADLAAATPHYREPTNIIHHDIGDVAPATSIPPRAQAAARASDVGDVAANSLLGPRSGMTAASCHHQVTAPPRSAGEACPQGAAMTIRATTSADTGSAHTNASVRRRGRQGHEVVVAAEAILLLPLQPCSHNQRLRVGVATVAVGPGQIPGVPQPPHHPKVGFIVFLGACGLGFLQLRCLCLVGLRIPLRYIYPLRFTLFSHSFQMIPTMIQNSARQFVTQRHLCVSKGCSFCFRYLLSRPNESHWVVQIQRSL